MAGLLPESNVRAAFSRPPVSHYRHYLRLTERAEAPVPDEPNRLLRFPEVIHLTGVSRSSIYRLIEQGDFPKPVSIRNARIRVWSAEAVTAWISAQLNQGD